MKKIPSFLSLVMMSVSAFAGTVYLPSDASPYSRKTPYTIDAGTTLLTNTTIAGINAQTGTSYTVLSSDNAKLITRTNASSMSDTLPQATTSGFGSNWYACYKNINSTSTSATAAGNTAFLTITPTTSTIDGASSITLGAMQSTCIYSDGTNYNTSGIEGLDTNQIIITATGNTTWTKPPNITYVHVFICGGGGGGGAGATLATDGAGGGGGGWCNDRILLASDVSATETVTVGLGGTAGVVGGAAAGAGGNSQFGATSRVAAFGGGPGLVAGATAGGGGGPGGPFSAGQIGTTTCGPAGIGTSNNTAAMAFGPGCGGNGTTTTGGSGIASGYQAGGGGAGANGNASGGGGGFAPGCTTNLSGGTGASTGTAGTAGSPTALNHLPGCGAGGGGGATTGIATVGGTGATGGGGGGGGGSTTGAGTAANGGPGGTGIAIIESW